MSNYGRQYKDVFEQVSYENRVILNDLSEYVKRKKLNAAAERQIMTEIAGKVLDCQKKDRTYGSRIDDDWYALGDKLCKSAPAKSIGEIIAVGVRKAAIYVFAAGLAALAKVLITGNNMYLTGDIALRVLSSVVLAVMLLPLCLYRAGLHASLTLIFPSTAAMDRSGILSILLNSLLYIGFSLAYFLIFWMYPETLVKLGFGAVRINTALWVLISAAVLILSYAVEVLLVQRNYRRYNSNTSD